MEIQKEQRGNELVIKVEGRLDALSALGLETELIRNFGETETLIFELGSLGYISSAGLRVLLAAQKVMNKQGNMIVKNVNESVHEIFEITGFVDILTIE